MKTLKTILISILISSLALLVLISQIGEIVNLFTNYQCDMSRNYELNLEDNLLGFPQNYSYYVENISGKNRIKYDSTLRNNMTLKAETQRNKNNHLSPFLSNSEYLSPITVNKSIYSNILNNFTNESKFTVDQFSYYEVSNLQNIKNTTIFIGTSLNDDSIDSNEVVNEIIEFSKENNLTIIYFDNRTYGKNNNLQFIDKQQFAYDYLSVIQDFYKHNPQGQFITIGASVGADSAAYACIEYEKLYTGSCIGSFYFSPHNYTGFSFSEIEEELINQDISITCFMGKAETAVCKNPIYTNGRHGWDCFQEIKDKLFNDIHNLIK